MVEAGKVILKLPQWWQSGSILKLNCLATELIDTFYFEVDILQHSYNTLKNQLPYWNETL